MAKITLTGVTKSYGAAQVIPPMDLEIREGEFVVLVGPSGCGKSTTLRMIAGLESVTSGAMHIGDREVTHLRPGLRNCAMVFQSYALYPHMSVRENIGYGMKVRGTPKAEAAEAIENAARILNLTDYLDRKPAALSGGQRQRVAIGRAIVRDPDVFLFDEPLSNLDAKLRVEMRVEIKQLHRRLKTTMVYVTHDQVEAMTMADRVVVLRDGVIEQAADPITLYERPANAFVAEFIGAPSMNMLEGRIEGTGQAMRFTSAEGLSFDLPPERAAVLAPYAGQEVLLGIRPEHTTEGEGGIGVTVEVLDIEPLGPHTLVIGQVGARKFTGQAQADTATRPGDRVAIRFDPAKLHFFRASDGAAIRED
ncbi:ABC transporter ATP-binding protein [Ponticoccus alexandrii]|uniref:Sn-glycerol-3-phosphate ABC transporter ATP-binding protein UgpC n=1 Tax=Ponticoccus alexandrii TaxID=1943633 RepID=A0ABX7FGG2_9RHOB|nr:sn-glycerol-3-phosphate ABC transporter ATP-binding protein UgpC [Ponticoccus alexandrii]KID12320.1 sugar ABC transporter ATPase [Rhodobacteraceae bacterium PD-2]QRF68828.1 sn-glycerol-3-phosphate ABC transporter ATP-binding protein UgpC [Ponticoccus alexandrii]